MEAMPSFKTAGTTYRTTQAHICEDLKPQLQHCETQKTLTEKQGSTSFLKI